MKNSLAVDQSRQENNGSEKKLGKRFSQAKAIKNGKTSIKLQISSQSKTKLENRSADEQDQLVYRNKNISSLPAPLLNSLSQLKVLDISHNKLTNVHMDLLLNSCLRLKTLCIQANLTNIIPASFWKLKDLSNFRHDWVKLFPNRIYESESNVRALKILVRKPESVIKVNNVVGMNFEIYCREVLKIEMDSELQQKVIKSQCSNFAQNQMIESIKLGMNEKSKNENSPICILEDQNHNRGLVGCFSICGFLAGEEEKIKSEKWKEVKTRKDKGSSFKSLGEIPQASHQAIKISAIRDMGETDGSSSSSLKDSCSDIAYHYQDMPLHMLFSKYDSNPQASVDIDRMLIKGYNPNTYDRNGLSAYHIPVIFSQRKGFQRLIDITQKNPGFFDLEMPSLKDGRNILHFCVFLKDFELTKKLIDFGLPIDKRDLSGARIIHLVDENEQFLRLLRKQLKKKRLRVADKSNPEEMKIQYTRHSPRVSQESKYHKFEHKNQTLINMYEAAFRTRI